MLVSNVGIVADLFQQLRVFPHFELIVQSIVDESADIELER